MDAVVAYLDAGSGSLLLQLILGGFAAVAVSAKLYWNRILRFLRIRKPEDEPAAEALPADAADAPEGAVVDGSRR
jgi:hypothetical protein